MKWTLSQKQIVEVVDTDPPEAARQQPVAHLLVHPGEDFIMTSLKELVLGEVQIIPVCRVHRLVKRFSTDSGSYAKLTHAMWNSIHGSGWGSKTLYGRATEEEASEIAKTIMEVREMLGTALAKHQSLMLAGTPKTAIQLMRLGYKVKARLKDEDGNPLPVCPVASSYVGGLGSFPGDPFTTWRKFAPMWKFIQDKDITLKDLPEWLISAAEKTT